MKTLARGDRRTAALVFGVLAVVFWLGRARYFGPGDSPQHALAALTWGVPHTPGYPLEIALGWLWSRLPWTSPEAAVNGLSGLYAAAAAAALFLLLRRQKVGATAALTGVALMALSPLFWYYSLVAEARALNDLLAIASALAVSFVAESGSAPLGLASCFLIGLGLSHHPSFLFVVPSLALWAAVERRRPAKTVVLQGAVVVLAGVALPYLALGLRLAYSQPAYNPWFVRSFSDLPALFLRRDTGGLLRVVAGGDAGFFGFGRFSAARLGEQLGSFFGAVWTHGGAAGAVLAAVGAYRLARTDRRSLAAWGAWLVLAAGAFIALASLQMTAFDPEYARAVAARHYLLPLVALFALAAHGAEELAGRVRPAVSLALAGAVAVLPLALRPLSLAGESPLRDYALGLVRDSRPGDFVVLGSDDTIFAAWNLQLVENAGRDRVFLTPSHFAYPSYAKDLAARHPDLALPMTPQGLSLDWELWKRLNPGRSALVEPSLRDPVLDSFPNSVPQGTLLRVEGKPVKSDPAADARAFLAFPETASWTRAQAREWTQEVYVLRSRKAMAEWVGSRLDPAKDPVLVGRLSALIKEL